VSFFEDDQCRDRAQHATRSMFVNLNERLIRPLLPPIAAVGRSNIRRWTDINRRKSSDGGAELRDSAIVNNSFVSN
jgi:hypothetical protein